jgi:hypothetical protein
MVSPEDKPGNQSARKLSQGEAHTSVANIQDDIGHASQGPDHGHLRPRFMIRAAPKRVDGYISQERVTARHCRAQAVEQ